MALSIMELNTDCSNSDYHLCRMTFMLSVNNKPLMLSVPNKPFMLSFLNKPFMLSLIILNAAMLSVAMLNVAAP